MSREAAMPRAVRFVHISDVHFGAANQAALDAVSEYIGQVRPDAVLLAGDITQNGRQRQLNRSIATLNSARIVEDGRLEGRNYQTQAAGLRAQARAISPFMTLVTAAIGTGASYIGDSTRVAENTARAVTAET